MGDKKILILQLSGKANIPLKIKIFLWLLKQDKILTKSNLMKKGWNSDTTYHFCGDFETTNHLFVTCSYT